MKFKPFVRQGRQVVLDEYAVTHIMPSLKRAKSWHVLCFIAFKTEGYNKQEDDISYSQIMKGTGISSPSTLAACLTELKRADYIIQPNEDRKDRWETNRYRLNMDYEVEMTDSSFATENVVKKRSTTNNVVKPTTENVDTDDDDNNNDKNNSFPRLLALYISGCGEMTAGQAEMFGDYFDDPECEDGWIHHAVEQTVIHNPASAFPYFKKTINRIIKTGGIVPLVKNGDHHATRGKSHGSGKDTLAAERSKLEAEIARLEKKQGVPTMQDGV